MSPGKSAVIILVLLSSICESFQDKTRVTSYRTDNFNSITRKDRNANAMLLCDSRAGTHCVFEDNHISRFMERREGHISPRNDERHTVKLQRDYSAISSEPNNHFRKMDENMERDSQHRISSRIQRSDTELLPNNRRVLNERRDMDIYASVRSDRTREKLKDMNRASEDRARIIRLTSYGDRNLNDRSVEDRRINRRVRHMRSTPIDRHSNTERQRMYEIYRQNPRSEKFSHSSISRDLDCQTVDNQRQQVNRANRVSRSVDQTGYCSNDNSRETSHDRSINRVFDNYRPTLSVNNRIHGRSIDSNTEMNDRIVGRLNVRNERVIDIERQENRLKTREFRHHRDIHSSRRYISRHEARIMNQPDAVNVLNEARITNVGIPLHRNHPQQNRFTETISQKSTQINQNMIRSSRLMTSKEVRDTDRQSSLSSGRKMFEDRSRLSWDSYSNDKMSSLSRSREIREDRILSRKPETGRMLSSRRNIRENIKEIRSMIQSNTRSREYRQSSENSSIRNHRENTEKVQLTRRNFRNADGSDLFRQFDVIKDRQMIPSRERILLKKPDDQFRIFKMKTINDHANIPRSEDTQVNKFTLEWINTLQIILGIYLIGEFFAKSKDGKKRLLQFPSLRNKLMREKVQ